MNGSYLKFGEARLIRTLSNEALFRVEEVQEKKKKKKEKKE